MLTIIIQEYFTYRLLFTINVKEISRQFLVTFLKSSHPYSGMLFCSQSELRDSKLLHCVTEVCLFLV